MPVFPADHVLRRIGALSLACLLFSAALPALAQPVTIETATGPVELEAAPETVAVYDMAALDTLDALGVPVAASISVGCRPEMR